MTTQPTKESLDALQSTFNWDEKEYGAIESVIETARKEGFEQGKLEGTISGVKYKKDLTVKTAREQGAERFVSLLKAKLNLEAEEYGSSGFGEGKIISIRAVQAIVSSKNLDTLLKEYKEGIL